MRYDSRAWREVEEPVVAEAVRLALIDFCAQEMRVGADDERRKRLYGLLSASRMRGITSVIRGRLARQGVEFDAHPHLLNVQNGVVDLRDGSLGLHDRELLFTKVAMTDYDPDARHDDWDKALTAVPEEVARWLQLRLGQGLTGYPPPDDVLVVLKGGGENGKSTLVNGVRRAVGLDYATALPDRALLSRPGDHPTELMTLRDARLAILEEFPELGHLSVKQLKTLLGTSTSPRATAVGTTSPGGRRIRPSSRRTTSREWMSPTTAPGGGWRWWSSPTATGSPMRPSSDPVICLVTAGCATGCG